MLHRLNRPVLCVALPLIWLTGCSTPRTPAGAQNSPAKAPTMVQANGSPEAAAAAAAAAANAGLAPFEQVIKGAESQAGLIGVWRKGDKLWLEVRPQAMNTPLFLSPKLATGIGEAGVFGGLMQSRFAQVGRPQWVEFRRVQQHIQLVAINSSFVADPKSPQAKAVKSAFSPSLFSSVPMASAPHPSSGGILIEATPLLMGDWLGMAQHLQRTYRQNYVLDPRNSLLQTARTQTGATVFELLQHFGTSGIIAPGSNAPGTPNPTVPLSQPDPRSMFVTLHLSLTPLPEQAMPRRTADPRVGFFTSTVADFSQDLPRTPRVRFINKWRLEKKDPAAALSEPIKPIVFWLDPSIPDAYRETITAGVLEWNKAFEAIGYKQAIEVRTPPQGQPFDTLQTGHASIRWMTNIQPAFGAIGPSHVDPRSGEILDAQIALESLSSRAIRTARSQILSQGAPAVSHSTGMSSDDAASLDVCAHGEQAYEQLDWGLQWLALQSAGQGLDPDAPEVQAFVLAYLKDTTMHEVGHALGLRHNFRASNWRSPQQLTDLQLTTSQGNSASVMDYGAINLPLPGKPGGAPFQTTLGPYDYWAIAYGYAPLSEDPQAAAAQLKAIADRAGQPAEAEALAYGTDEDQGQDAEVITFDLGNDPVAFARTRLAIVKDLIQREARRPVAPMADPSLPRRTVGYALRELGRTEQVLLKQIGGLVARRAPAFQGGDALHPVSASRQREALDLLLQGFLSPQSIDMPATLMRRLAPDYQERVDMGDGQLAGVDFSWADAMLAIQRPVLDLLTSDALAERLMDNIDKSRDIEAHPLTIKEVQQKLFDALWVQGSANDAQALCQLTTALTDPMA